MATTAATRRTWSKPPFIRDARLRWTLGLGVALYLAIAFGTLDINWTRVAEGLPRAEAFLGAFFPPDFVRSEEHTSELQSLMRISYAVFCLKNKKQTLKKA